jgi:hypothetical protein
LKQAVLYPGFQAPAFPPNYYGQGANPVIGNTGITQFGVGNFETLQNLAIPISGMQTGTVRQQSPNTMGPLGQSSNNFEEIREVVQDVNNSGYDDRAEEIKVYDHTVESFPQRQIEP